MVLGKKKVVRFMLHGLSQEPDRVQYCENILKTAHRSKKVVEFGCSVRYDVEMQDVSH